MQTDFTKDEDHQVGGDEDVPQPAPPARLEEDETMETVMAATAPVSGDNKEGIASTTAIHGHDKDDDGDYSGKVGNHVEVKAEPEFQVVQITLLLLISFLEREYSRLSSHRCHWKLRLLLKQRLRKFGMFLSNII